MSNFRVLKVCYFINIYKHKIQKTLQHIHKTKT